MAIATFGRHIRTALWRSMDDDVLNTAKATAYSGMLMLFPTFLVLTTVLAVVPEGYAMMDMLRDIAAQVLPADTMTLVLSYFQKNKIYPLTVVLSALSLSTFAALGVMATLMEGFRRAYRLQRDSWGFWQRRIRAVLLVPIALLPLSICTVILVFGHPFEKWVVANSQSQLIPAELVLWRMARWSLALITSTSVLGALYHFGTRRYEHWAWVAPGAIAASVLWFPTTLAYGWYVTRFADYSAVYGPLGTGIATLVWLYLTSFSILFGAELNGVLYRERQETTVADVLITTPLGIPAPLEEWDAPEGPPDFARHPAGETDARFPDSPYPDLAHPDLAASDRPSIEVALPGAAHRMASESADAQRHEA